MNTQKDYFIQIPLWLLRAKKIRHTAKLVYGYILFKGYKDKSWTGLFSQIALDTSIPYGTVKKDIAQLRAIGILTVLQFRTKDNKTGQWSVKSKFLVNR